MIWDGGVVPLRVFDRVVQLVSVCLLPMRLLGHLVVNLQLINLHFQLFVCSSVIISDFFKFPFMFSIGLLLRSWNL